MSVRGFVGFVIYRKTISPDGRTQYTQQCLLNQASPVKKSSLKHKVIINTASICNYT
jgi:hypothetical protein